MERHWAAQVVAQAAAVQAAAQAEAPATAASALPMLSALPPSQLDLIGGFVDQDDDRGREL
jgi:hypothetical protein